MQLYKVMYRKVIAAELSPNSPSFMESEDSSLCPAQPATGIYPKPDKSSHYHTSHFFIINFNIPNWALLGYYAVRSVNSFSEYNQQDVTFLNSFISVRHSTCFRWFFRPSPGAQNCTYSVRYLSDHYC